MGNLILVAIAVAFATLAGAFPAQAGIVRHGVKPAAKVATYPMRHPKKSAHAVRSAIRRVVW